MSEFIVDADVLASARFGTSQLTETVSALKMLLGPSEPWYRAWRETHLAGWRAHLAAHPLRRAIVEGSHGPRWTADFLTVPPLAPGLSLADELRPLLAMTDDDIRADLETVRSPLSPAVAEGRELAGEVAALLRWVWTITVEPDWPRRYRVLQADIVSRTSSLSERGWSGVLHGLGPDVRWLGNGRLQANSADFPPTDIRGRDLMFIATHTRTARMTWRLPDRYAIAYPVTGIFAAVQPLAEPLVRLLGRNRARILVEAAAPISTTALVARTGLALATVADHLRVLSDAGLLHRRRSGRQVLYWQTPAGCAVADSPERPTWQTL